MSIRDNLTIHPANAKEPLIGRWLSYLNDGRERTKNAAQGLTKDTLEYQQLPVQNSIGTLLYHIALIEADWLYVEILEQDYPDHAKAWFPFEDRDATRRLSVIKGWELSKYLELLDNVHHDVIETLSKMTLEEFSRARKFEHYDVTPEWVCLHLLEHEAAHRGQILLIKEYIQKVQPPSKV